MRWFKKKPEEKISYPEQPVTVADREAKQRAYNEAMIVEGMDALTFQQSLNIIQLHIIDGGKAESEPLRKFAQTLDQFADILER